MNSAARPEKHIVRSGVEKIMRGTKEFGSAVKEARNTEVFPPRFLGSELDYFVDICQGSTWYYSFDLSLSGESTQMTQTAALIVNVSGRLGSARSG